MLELLVSQELPKEDVTVEKFLEHWPQIAKCFLDEEIDQGMYKIMLGLQRTDKFSCNKIRSLFCLFITCFGFCMKVLVNIL